ncbi:MAG: hypothetical protein IPJ34_24105 [Myxococcales bacterium]|nr:hypothetical protein [Myxococcales bacterium]
MNDDLAPQLLLQRLTMTASAVADPAIAAFADPARQVFRQFLGALRRDTRARVGGVLALVLTGLLVVGALVAPPTGRASESLLGPSASHTSSAPTRPAATCSAR